MIKLKIKQILNRFALTKESRPQRLRVSKTVFVKSRQTVVLPLPLDNCRQRLIEYDVNLKTNRCFSRQYRIITAKPDSDCKLNLVYTVSVKPVYQDISKLNLFKPLDSFDKNLIDKINPYDKKIQSLAKQIKTNSIPEFVLKSYNLVIAKLRYGKPIKGLYSYKQALTLPEVDCGGFCTLLSSILLTRRISVDLAVGQLYSSKSKSTSMHVWLEIPLKTGSIFPLDPSVDWRNKFGLSSRLGGFGKISSYHINLSYGVNHFIKELDRKIVLIQNVLKYYNV
ncbi:MAG: hypothetical protein KatS3mg090_0874 [Patescibacteria group bacterium]|nr:MAG: hypothetical protein KatS3mg090_0874 [Patescibacteria group bacterium]